MTYQVWIAVSGFLLATGFTLLGYVVGRAFQREEFVAIQLENIHLRGTLDRECRKTRAVEKQCLELKAVLEHKQILERALAPEGQSVGRSGASLRA